MTSYTDKHLAKATEVFGDAYETGNGRDAIQVIAEALANAEREAFKRAAEIAYSEPGYVVGFFSVDDDGLLLPGSPYDQGRYDARKAILAAMEGR